VSEFSQYPTNTPFAITFDARLGEFDPEIGRPIPGEKPSGSVTADGYEFATVPFVFR
jgi:hypothetical protein